MTVKIYFKNNFIKGEERGVYIVSDYPAIAICIPRIKKIIPKNILDFFHCTGVFDNYQVHVIRIDRTMFK